MLQETGALSPTENELHDMISNFFWEAQILATCCDSTTVLTEVLCIPDKTLILLLGHLLHKLTEMSLVPFMRDL